MMTATEIAVDTLRDLHALRAELLIEHAHAIAALGLGVEFFEQQIARAEAATDEVLELALRRITETQ